MFSHPITYPLVGEVQGEGEPVDGHRETNGGEQEADTPPGAAYQQLQGRFN